MVRLERGEGQEQTNAPQIQTQDEEETKIVFGAQLWHLEALRLLKQDKHCKYLMMNGGILTAKTSFASCMALEVMDDNPNGIVWWIAGLDFQLRAFWEEFQPRAIELGIFTKTSPYKFARHWNKCRLMAVTAANPELISAFHPIFIFGDECAKWKPSTYNLVRARMIRGAKAFFFSSPRPSAHWIKNRQRASHHKDPARKYWEKVWRSKDGRWALIEAGTREVGIASEEEIKALEEELPSNIASQELDGVIIEGEGSVFSRIKEAYKGNVPQAPIKGRIYTVTFDPGKVADYGVMAVWDGYQLVYAERFHKVEYTFQSKRVVDLAEEYNNAALVYERNGPGEVVGEMIENEIETRRLEIGVVAIFVDGVNKAAMVNRASLLLERGRVGLIDPDHGEPYDVFVNELQAYEAKRTRGGVSYSYAAPSGQHDDTVSTLLLRVSGDAAAPSVRVVDVDGTGDVVSAKQSARLRFSSKVRRIKRTPTK